MIDLPEFLILVLAFSVVAYVGIHVIGRRKRGEKR
jgi:hypothetical protein